MPECGSIPSFGQDQQELGIETGCILVAQVVIVTPIHRFGPRACNDLGHALTPDCAEILNSSQRFFWTRNRSGFARPCVDAGGRAPRQSVRPLEKRGVRA